MNENYENNELMELEKLEDNNGPINSDSDGGNRGGAGLLGVGLAVVGGAVYLWKNKEKIKQKHTEKQIAKWEKKGYTVTKCQDLEEEVNEELTESEETSEE